MWELQNNTPFASERSWVRDRNGAEIWLVAVKGTFHIKPDGTTELAEKQEEVLLAPEYSGEPGMSSLLYESDLVLTKPATDFLLHGHAYSSEEKPVVDVMLKVADMQKKLRVFGDRFWENGLRGLKMTDPLPFDKMPIVYERAFGGTDQKNSDPQKQGWEPRNPIGTGFAVKSEHLIGQRLPNIENPDELITSWEARPCPAGFGPIPGQWAPRLKFAGTYDDTWMKERQPLVPQDFDDRFFHCAPADQQSNGHLRGGEPVELYNLTPGRVLNFTLPRISLGFTTSFYKGSTIDHRAVLHTIILEPDVPRVIMVWHTALPCHPRVHYLEKTTIRQKEVLIGFKRQEDLTAKVEL